MSPLKANAPLAKGRRDKLTGARGYLDCAHAATFVERMPEGHVHYAAERCADCGVYIRWLPRPENVARGQLNVLRLEKLAMCERLTPWEVDFVRSVSQRRKVSPKQQEIIDRLAASYLEEAA